MRAVAGEEGVAISFYEAAGDLWKRPWPMVLILAVAGLAGGLADATLSTMVNLIASPGRDDLRLSLALASQITGGVLVAYTAAIFELVRLQSFLALDLERRGLLPAPRTPPPAPQVGVAEPVIEARPVDPWPTLH